MRTGRETDMKMAFLCKDNVFFCQDSDIVNTFLDKTLTSRLATRLLCEHHILLHNQVVRYFLILFTFNSLCISCYHLWGRHYALLKYQQSDTQ